MRWPIDDKTEQDLAGRLFSVRVGKQVQERLLLERSIAKRHGFLCFADYYMARRPGSGQAGQRPGCRGGDRVESSHRQPVTVHRGGGVVIRHLAEPG
jgi:hypothetical protein